MAPRRPYTASMTSEQTPGSRMWPEGMSFDAAAESMRLGSRRILESATRVGEQLSARLAEVPLFDPGDGAPSRIKELFERWSKRVTIRSIMKLVVHRKRVKATLQEIPVRMQLVTNQVRLVLELIDDFATGSYRGIPWHSMALAAGAVLYSVSPTDIVPDVLPLVGSLDDLFLMGLALRLIDKDLRAYAASKGYDVAEYFPDSHRSASPAGTSKVEG